MARKIIQLINDNFFEPSSGQYCGIIALCDDGTIFSGHITGGGVIWSELNAPDTMEGANLHQPTGQVSPCEHNYMGGACCVKCGFCEP